MKKNGNVVVWIFALMIAIICLGTTVKAEDYYDEDYYEEEDDSKQTEDGFKYEINDEYSEETGDVISKYVYIYKYDGNQTDIVIPESIENYPVKVVYLSADGINETACSITLSKNVENFVVNRDDFTFIDDINVVEDNQYYKSIDGILYNKSGTRLMLMPSARRGRLELPEGVISCEAGNNFEHITEIYLPSTFKGFNYYWYGDDEYSCEGIFWRTFVSLSSIEVSPDNECLLSQDGILYSKNKEKITLLKCPPMHTGEINYLDGVKVVEKMAFNGTQCEKIELPEGIISICDKAFVNCINLKTIILPSTLENIGEEVFLGCSSLDCNVLFRTGDSKFKLEDGIIYTSDSKTIVTLIDANKKIINIPDGVEVISEYAFAGTGITEINMPDSVEIVGEWAFMNCYSLSNVRLSENIKTLSEYLFCGCLRLKEITIPKSVTRIESEVFLQCFALSRVNMLCDKLDFVDDLFMDAWRESKLQILIENANVYDKMNEVVSCKDSFELILLQKKEPLELSLKEVTLYTGNKKNAATVKATVNDVSGTVNWKSSNKKVATVNNGKIKAVKKGTAIITATIGNISQTVKVTVKNPEIKVVDGSETVSNIKVKKSKTIYYQVYTNPSKSNVSISIDKKSKKYFKVVLKNNTLSIKGTKKGNGTFILKSGAATKKIKVRVEG